MIRILILLLIVMSSVAFSQAQEKEPVKFFEYGKISDSLLKEKLYKFKAELLSGTQGYIINFGNDKEIAQREKQIQKVMAIVFRGNDPPRITIVRGGTCKESKTELWVVSPGAENPIPCGKGNETVTLNPKPKAYLLSEISEANKKVFSDKFEIFFQRLVKDKTFNGYITLYGSDAEIADFEAIIKSLDNFKKYTSDQSISDRITFIRKALNQGQSKVTLEIAPQGSGPSNQ